MNEQCPLCGEEMRAEHEHDRCDSCGLIIGCCEGAPQLQASSENGGTE